MIVADGVATVAGTLGGAAGADGADDDDDGTGTSDVATDEVPDELGVGVDADGVGGVDDDPPMLVP